MKGAGGGGGGSGVGVGGWVGGGAQAAPVQTGDIYIYICAYSFLPVAVCINTRHARATVNSTVVQQYVVQFIFLRLQ